MTDAVLALSPQSSGNLPAPAAEKAESQGFSFGDLLSVINPLQHIPIVGSIYRAITGDTIHPVSRILGGALFGGPIGLVSSIASAIYEQVTGSDIGAQAIAFLTPSSDDAAPNPQTMLASADSQPRAGDIALPVPPVQVAGAQQPDSSAMLAQAAMPIAPHKIDWFTERQVAKVDPEFVPTQTLAALNPIGSEKRPALDGRKPTNVVPLSRGMDPGVMVTSAQMMAQAPSGQNGQSMASPTTRGVPLSYQVKQNIPTSARFAPPVPNAPVEPKPIVQTPVTGPVAFAAPIAPAAPTPGPWFAEAMARGLDRYADAARQPTGTKIDVSK